MKNTSPAEQHIEEEKMDHSELSGPMDSESEGDKEENSTSLVTKIWAVANDTAHKLKSETHCKPGNKRKRNKRKNLSVRADVMNKNLFRAIKREIKTCFKDYLSSSKLKNTKKNFDIGHKSFCDHLLKIYGEMKELKSFNQDTYELYLRILVNYCQVKKEANSSATFNMLNTTFDVLYSYSHKKFFDFLAIPEIKFIIKSVIHKVGVSKFISHHSVLVANEEKYKKLIFALLEDKLERA